MQILKKTQKHDNGFYLSTGSTRVNQTIRSLLPASRVFSLKIRWVKCVSILRVHSYKLRLSFYAVFCVVRAMRECNLGIILSKHLTKSDLWQELVFDRTYMFPCVVHHHDVQEGLGLIPVPCILKMKLVPPSLPQSYVSSSFWFIL